MKQSIIFLLLGLKCLLLDPYLLLEHVNLLLEVLVFLGLGFHLLQRYAIVLGNCVQLSNAGP